MDVIYIKDYDDDYNMPILVLWFGTEGYTYIISILDKSHPSSWANYSKVLHEHNLQFMEKNLSKLKR